MNKIKKVFSIFAIPMFSAFVGALIVLGVLMVHQALVAKSYRDGHQTSNDERISNSAEAEIPEN